MQTQFYIEQERKFNAALASHFKLAGSITVDGLLSSKDVYHTSFIRFFDAIQRHCIYESNGTLYYTDRFGAVSEFTGTLSNYLQCIGKNVYLEMLRKEKRHHCYDSAEIKNESDAYVEKTSDLNDDDEQNLYIPQHLSKELIEEEFDPDRNWLVEAVWTVVKNMDGVCRMLLKELLTKDETGKTDKDIAVQLHYSNADSVKNQRSRCMKVFRSAIKKRMAFYG